MLGDCISEHGARSGELGHFVLVEGAITVAQRTDLCIFFKSASEAKGEMGLWLSGEGASRCWLAIKLRLSE